jgi:hypothetical protein
LAAAKALPDAVQVADRWRLMENASRAFLDAVRKSMRQVRAAVGAATINPSLLIRPGAGGDRICWTAHGGHEGAGIPVVLAGYSRGSYATAWAMHKNFVEDCDRDVPDGACRPPLGRANIKGVILYGPNSAGVGYRLAGHDMIEAALRTESTRPITSIPTCSRTPASGRR